MPEFVTLSIPGVIPGLVPGFIPSPSRGVWEPFGFPIRAYALCIIAGIILAMIIGTKRWVARGGSRDTVESVVVVAVPFGIVGARIYHVITDPELYFAPGKIWYHAFFIWQGGLGIWGAVALGALGAWLVCRRRKVRFPALIDALAPGIVVAQAVGRLGNWFNQELFGGPTTLPWGLEIALQYRPPGYTQYATFHPTFLYELLWDLATAAVLVWLDRKFTLGHGKVFTLYVMIYTAGRFWIEALRIDDVNHLGGFRLNNYTSLIVFVAATAFFVYLVRNKPGRETFVEGEPAVATPEDAVEGDTAAEDAGAPEGDSAAEDHTGTSPSTGSGNRGADERPGPTPVP